MSYKMRPDSNPAVDSGQSAESNSTVTLSPSKRVSWRRLGLRLGSIGLSLLATNCTVERATYESDAGGSASNSATASASQSTHASASTAATSTGLVPTGPAATDTASASSASSTPSGADAGGPDANSAPTESAPDASNDAQSPVDTNATDSGPPNASDAALPDASEADGGTPDTGNIPEEDAGPVVPPDDDVHGRVIDFYGRALPDIEVQIGAALVTTNDDGEFTVADVPETYTVEFRVDRNGFSGDPYIWRYIGLTRRDPTLQSFQTALPERYAGMFADSDLPNNSTDKISLAFGSEQGSQRKNADSSNASVDWAGPDTLAATGHALVKHLTGDIPTSYGAYEEQNFSLEDTADLTWNLAVDGAPDLATGNVSGTVSVDDESYIENYAFVQFASNALLSLFDTHLTTPAFTHLVPSIPNASILLLADNTLTQDYSGAYAYRRNLAPGQSDVTIHIPAPAKLKEPLPAVTPDDATLFRWTSDAAVSVLHIEDSGSYRGIYIVTSKKSLTWGEIDSHTLRAGQNHTWEVQTHGNCQDVDACAGPEGALDPMYFYTSGTLGVVEHDGSAAWTGRFGFTTP